MVVVVVVVVIAAVAVAAAAAAVAVAVAQYGSDSYRYSVHRCPSPQDDELGLPRPHRTYMYLSFYLSYYPYIQHIDTRLYLHIYIYIYIYI